MNEQSGDVYEKKGPDFCGRSQSGNVIENKVTYASKAGMLLKRRWLVGWEIGFRIQDAGLGRAGFRCQVPSFKCQGLNEDSGFRIQERSQEPA